MPVVKGQNITETLFPLGFALVLSASLLISQGTPLKKVFSGFYPPGPQTQLEAPMSSLIPAQSPQLVLDLSDKPEIPSSGSVSAAPRSPGKKIHAVRFSPSR
jgi:hypothetical protein